MLGRPTIDDLKRAKAETREKALVEMPALFRASRQLRNDQEWSCRASKGYRTHQDRF